VAGGDDQTVIFWDIATGEARKTLTGHTGRIYALAFTADGRTLLTGALDGTARLWDWQSGNELHRFVGQGLIGSAIFSPDEQFVLVGSSDGKVVRTPAGIEGLVQSACRRVLRDLTPDERVQYSVRSEAPTCADLAQ
jgi:WD40 repeat protein